VYRSVLERGTDWYPKGDKKVPQKPEGVQIGIAMVYRLVPEGRNLGQVPGKEEKMNYKQTYYERKK